MAETAVAASRRSEGGEPPPHRFWSGDDGSGGRATLTPRNRRTDIIRALLRRGHASVEELAADLDLSPGAVRNHLTALAADELVTRREEIAGPGRPRHLYTATLAANSTLPGRYAAFSMQLLAAARAAGAREADFAEALATPLISRLHDEGEGGTAAEQAARVVRVFDEAGFVTDVLAPGTGTAIVSIAHCPLMELARHDTVVCAAELIALQRGLPGVDVQRIDHAPSGSPACAFRLHQARSAPERRIS